ncbi:Phosphoethanolamine N-methyltransferase-related protein [Tritrichomonas foetus]|uniref:Phosphoethanolamine N-methyltransferase-related protein n=1 Tax=Tritrichomonas foetus TaxID=1144522 RepID=A0A1J4JGT6_9EUKA|nr:Phosphoethanolamine N-methyltransferase-related protein [Tritrichomonas foetus]|eukprot:OHS98362.1 Phosphoethanolamine N-methyltransferase-related protein [Tritrichomonas foetus]
MKQRIIKLDLSKINEEEEEPPDFEENDGNDTIADKDSAMYPDYGSADFWDKRYKIEFLPFDWYMPWKELQPVIQPYIPAQKEKSLVIGCGNSTMSFDLKNSGFPEVISIDISPAVIEKMKRKHPDLQWLIMDVADLKFDENYFDIIFDKGTIDAITCSDDAKTLVKKSSQECFRVLKPNGIMFMVTYEKPNVRLSLMKRTKVPWKVLTPLFLPTNYKGTNDMGTYVYMFQKIV